MAGATELIATVLGPAATLADARHVLDRALRAGVDPLHWCAVQLGIGSAEVMRRGAAWAGLAFYDTIPAEAAPVIPPDRVTSLHAVRAVRAHVFDRDIIFAAPDLFGLLRLRLLCQDQPHLRGLLCLVPHGALRALLTAAAAPDLLDGARQNLSRRWPLAAAQLDLTGRVRWSFVALVVLLVLTLLVAPHLGQDWLLPLWAGVLLLPSLLRLAALVPVAPLLPPPPLADVALPRYSVLIPLRDEANMVPQLYAALARIEYPPEKIEFLFVVEQRSTETVLAVKRHLGDPRVHLVEVPDAAPRTKPKALDFALPLCRGELVVVFDAEDRPGPDQLRRVAALFRHDPRLECVQARLVIANGARGLLPALFAGEYAGLFAVLLPALARWGAVVPLGGTSNHFRLETLRALGGWDAFNVTEDADLGVRLARRRLRIAVSPTRTLEDAPRRLPVWMGQRTRWMKGWMQTFIVHNRRPQLLLADLGGPGFLLFELLLGGMLLGPLLHLAYLASLLPLAGLWIVGLAPFPQQLSFFLAVLLFGHGTAIVGNIVGLARVGQGHLWPSQLLLPAYWLLIGIATLRALVDLARRPFHWFKTPHDVVVRDTPVPAESERATGRGR